MIPVVELLRVSTEGQASDDAAGIPAQRTVNRMTAERYGLAIIESVEIVVSGAEVVGTPAMGRVLDAISMGRAKGVLLAEYSRLFRPDRWSDLVVLQTFADHDAKIYLPSGPIDLQSEIGFVQATINNLLAAMERRRIRERMMRGKEEHRRRGKWVGGHLPLGMDYTREGGWSWNEDAVIVREMFRRFLDGERSFAALGRAFGMPWQSVRYILKNPVYSGWRVYDRRDDGTRRPPGEVIRVRLPIDPLISEDEFARVQEILARKRVRFRWALRDDLFLYRGMLECVCGHPCYTHHCNSGAYYYCRTTPRGHRRWGVPCGNGYMQAATIEPLLDAAIRDRLLDADVIVRAVEAHQAAQVGSGSQQDAAEIDARLRTLSAKRGRVVELYVDGLIDRSERDRRLAKLDAEIAATERMMGRTQAAPVRETEAVVDRLVSTLAEWEFVDRAGRRRILEALEPRFVVRKYGVEGVKIPIGRCETSRGSKIADGFTTLYIPLVA